MSILIAVRSVVKQLPPLYYRITIPLYILIPEISGCVPKIDSSDASTEDSLWVHMPLLLWAKWVSTQIQIYETRVFICRQFVWYEIWRSGVITQMFCELKLTSVNKLVINVFINCRNLWAERRSDFCVEILPAIGAIVQFCWWSMQPT